MINPATDFKSDFNGKDTYSASGLCKIGYGTDTHIASFLYKIVDDKPRCFAVVAICMGNRPNRVTNFWPEADKKTATCKRCNPQRESASGSAEGTVE